mgnify:CR=1 FL=1
MKNKFIKSIVDESTYLDQEIALSPGDKVEGGFRLRYTGGGNENATYHRGNGIFLLGYPKGEHQITNLETVPAKYFAPVLRQKILPRIAEVFPEDTQDFASALLIGETSGLSYRDRSALKTSGIYHVVAVSGMHVSILFSLIYIVCRKRRVLTAIITPHLFSSSTVQVRMMTPWKNLFSILMILHLTIVM